MCIASGNELSPQSMPDMESSDCCSQSGRDMLFQNWFNLKFAGLPGPVGPKWCLGSCFHHYFVVLDDIIKSVINNNIWVWDNDNCHYGLISIVFFTGWFNFIVLLCVFLVELLTWLHWLTCIYPVLQVCICWKWVLQGRMPLTPAPQSHGRGRALHVIPLVPGEV